MNISQLAKAHNTTVETAQAIIKAAIEYAESKLDLEYNSPAGRMQSEEAERALWLVHDFAQIDSVTEELEQLQDFDPYDWHDD